MRKTIIKKCLFCNKKFTVELTYKNQKFCNQQCYWGWVKGKSCEQILGSKEKADKRKENLSKALKGRKVTWGKKISKGRKGIKFTKKHCNNISKGKKGIPQTKEVIEKRIKSRRNNGKPWNSKETSAKIGKGNAGKKRSPELRKRIGDFRRDKSYEEIMGKEKAKKTKNKQSKAQKIAQNRPEVRKKKRQAAVKRIEKNNGICWPNYSPKGCEYYKSWDEKNNTHGQYAVYGGGERYIKELGYFLDYINDDFKKISEWDDLKHYDRNGNLKLKDMQRQKEIQEFHPDHFFERIKVDKDDNIIEIKLYPALNFLKGKYKNEAKNN